MHYLDSLLRWMRNGQWLDHQSQLHAQHHPLPWWHLSCPQQLTNAHALPADRKNVAKAPCTDALEKADKEKEKIKKHIQIFDNPLVYELLFLSFELDYLVSLLFVA